MTDRENVIKGLECCTGDLSCTKCPYHEEEYCRSALERDALELLKERENIVRCKTCKYWDDTSECRYIGGWCFCDRLKFSTSPDWYCADGEEKTDAAD